MNNKRKLNRTILLSTYYLLIVSGLCAQNINLNEKNLEAVNVIMSFQQLDNEKVIRVVSEYDKTLIVNITNLISKL